MAAVHATTATHQHLFFGLRLELHPIGEYISLFTKDRSSFPFPQNKNIKIWPSLNLMKKEQRNPFIK